MAQATTESATYSKDNPFPAKLKENRLLSKEGSAKDVRHYSVDLTGSGLSYTCGDSLGVYPTNEVKEVEEILECLRLTGEEMVTLPRGAGEASMREALSAKLSLAGPTVKFLKFLREKVSETSEQERLDQLLAEDHKDQTKVYLEDRHFIDLLQEFPSAQLSGQEFVDNLRKLMPRLYSIASSPEVFPDEIHLTVATVRYRANERERIGVCSTYLADRVPLNEPTVPVFVASSHFGLPETLDKDLIMVGPGTGIAPFRAFQQEIIAKKADVRTWVFFGDQHRATDYLYEEEWEEYRASGQLTKLDLAWSRDQEKKVYVQDKMWESGEELWQWLQGGAYFYVCGDAKRMAKDVDAMLHRIAEHHGKMSEEEAKDWVKQLKKDKRYQRDVY